MRRPLALAVAAAAALTAAAPAAAARHDWPQFGYDGARSNFSKSVAGVGAGDLAHMKRQDVAVPGTVDSSPIYVHAVVVKGAVHDAFVATTSYGRTFAIDARTGARLWTFSPASAGKLEGGHQITQSTPAVDNGHTFVFVVTPDGHVRKLRLSDGRQVTSGQWPARLTRDPLHEKLGTPLNISGPNVIATTGGYTGDTPPYQGKVALIDRKSGRLVRVFNSLCSNRGGVIDPATCSESGSAIWGRGGAVVVPGSRRVLVSTGDGKFNGKTHWGDSVLELSPDLSRLVGNWTPTDADNLETGDVDLGSTAPALLRSGERWLALQGGKDAKLRLLDVANLNGHGKACNCKNHELQTLDAGDGVFTAPAVWRHDGATWAFVANLFGRTTAYRLSTGAKPRLRRVWSVGRGGTSPVIAGGLLYVYSPSGEGVSVYRPATGKRVGTLAAAGGHWNSPIVADGRVAIPTGDSNDHSSSGTITIYRK
ncbi:MAG TPA: PQQ-binding-like beta-propeller repeat protein [Thermoleophilaceae bacterium]|nr:PQQ-binding-like beta-propeller repeat protein [Thermoleophilaceae bacterium]